MNNAELLQQLATLNWLLRTDNSSSSPSESTGEVDRARQLFTLVSGGRVVDEVYQRITKKREIEQAWSALILRVADFVKSHPSATESQQVDFVRAELKSFEEYVNSL